MVKEKVYLFTMISFGKFRENPQTVKQIIDSGKKGISWVWWLINASYNFKPAQEVLNYLQRKADECGYILSTE